MAQDFQIFDAVNTFICSSFFVLLFFSHFILTFGNSVLIQSIFLWLGLQMKIQFRTLLIELAEIQKKNSLKC